MERTTPITYYLENLPSHVDNRLLRDLIHRRWALPLFSSIVDVFIPHARNKKGLRYGFIEMIGVSDEKEMEAALNNKKIGASPLTCSIGKGRRYLQPLYAAAPKAYPKTVGVVKSVTKRWMPVLPPENPPASWASDWPQLPNFKTQNMQEPIITIPLCIPDENKNWLDKCVVGVLKKIELIPDIHERVSDLGWTCECKILGSGLLCLEFDSVKGMEEALADRRDEVFSLFYKMLPWKNLVTDSGRCTWIQCSGIPLQTWGVDTFRAIANSLGTYIIADDNSLSRKRLDVARILIATDRADIDLKIRGVMGEASCIVHCKEEPTHGLIKNSDWMLGLRDKREICNENSDNGGDEYVEDTLAGSQAFLRSYCEEEVVSESKSENGRSVTSPISRFNGHVQVQTSNPPPTDARTIPGLNIGTVASGSSGRILEGEFWTKGTTMGVTAKANKEALIRFDLRRRAAEAAETQGLAAASKRNNLKTMLSKFKVEFCMIQETKKEVIDDFLINSIWNEGGLDWCFSPSSGRSGGLLSLWHKDSFEVKNIDIGKRYIWVEGTATKTNFQCILLNIYAFNNSTERKLLWQSLSTKISLAACPVLVSGDFNEVLLPSERFGCDDRTRSMTDFGQWVEDNSLMDVPLENRQFTWSNACSRSKIDRFLVQSEWIDYLSGFTLKGLPKNGSDHTPLLLSCDKVDWGPKPFRTLDCWWLDPEFEVKVRNWWNEAGSVFPGDKKLITKLKWLKKKIREWNLTDFGLIETKLRDLINRQDALDCLADDRALDPGEQSEFNSILSELPRLKSQVESLWRMKNRKKWIVQGDRNTKYFHRVAKLQSRMNYFAEIRVDQEVISDPTCIKAAAANHFEAFFKADPWERPKFVDLGFKKLNPDQIYLLDRPVLDIEIKEAIDDCGSDKTPGPDGYSFQFIKKAWSIIGKEYCCMIRGFFRNGRFPSGANSSFLTIIPKKPQPQTFSDFRPISLVSNFYKTISKIMASRLAKVMPSLVSCEQHGFRSKFQTLDCVMAANEVANYLNKSKKPGIFFKLDFEKAFDSVEWSYLDDILELMGFSVSWRGWLLQCLSSSKVSVLVNGSPSREFSVGRGLRQGCPMSPLLFNLAAEGMHLLLERAVHTNLLHEIGNPSKGWSVGHIQFADDTLIFLGDPECDVHNIKIVLRWFEAFSGLKINFHKSSLSSFNMAEDRSKSAADLLGCKRESLPISYLGSYIGFKARRIKSWDFLIDKIHKKLPTWKGKLLSCGGRITLINAVIRCLPIYNLSIYRMPVGVVSKCESIMKNFLWSGEDKKRVLHKVNWEEVCKPKINGGLGIGNLASRNDALLFKWVWNLFDGNNKIWCKIVKNEYGWHSHGTFWNFPRRAENQCWSDIRNIWWRDEKKRAMQTKNSSLCLGNGSSASFWWDYWQGSSNLISRFNSLYELCTLKEGLVQDFIGSRAVINVWQIGWPEELSSHDAALLQSLRDLCTRVSLNLNSDKMTWKPGFNSLYSVNSCTLEIDLLRNNLTLEPRLNSCWNKLVPHKVAFFSWLAIRQCIASRYFLKCRHILIGDDSCPACGEVSETANHILIHCKFAYNIWRYYLKWLGISFVLPESVADLWDSWKHLSDTFAGDCSRWCEILFFVIIWHLWLRRNSLVFSQQTRDEYQVTRNIFVTWFYWISSFDTSFPYDLNSTVASSTWLHVWQRAAINF